MVSEAGGKAGEAVDPDSISLAQFCSNEQDQYSREIMTALFVLLFRMLPAPSLPTFNVFLSNMGIPDWNEFKLPLN